MNLIFFLVSKVTVLTVAWSSPGAIFSDVSAFTLKL